jgi:hypothetical protein
VTTTAVVPKSAKTATSKSASAVTMPVSLEHLNE